MAQAITDRVAETEEATRKLETNLKKTVDEIAEVETTMRRLKDAIWDKDAPNKVGLLRGARHFVVLINLFTNFIISYTHNIYILLILSASKRKKKRRGRRGAQ